MTEIAPSVSTPFLRKDFHRVPRALALSMTISLENGFSIRSEMQWKKLEKF